ncbi:NAD(P)H-dependent oxidoreductase [Neisseria animalis]|uniref:NAD(P)H-dependent oxidoreductase n=1 Tax=Neisseria animalis TaxID=492 RepID=A0A5P3MQF4_NEIAN|nr:NAD(P)H-dependent oxidoreductase [Neisseria animalis]QEY23806.1 NAD(P)H-dependent oxidoreductase [Neisseria animalis]ROW31586.1 NAD(P)H-dependent oxidoreductase [Neisseria animalis]VEE09764.1 oxidoreductase, NAD(P)H-flavin [Neisseria animalis]
MSVSKQDVLDAFHFRTACRHYDGSRKISREDIDYILELGRLSPSSVGSEPWKFIVIQDQALRAAIKPIGWGVAAQLDDCSHLVVILAKKNARYDSEFMRDVLVRRGLSGDKLEAGLAVYKKFQVNDMKQAENEQTLFDWAAKQTYIALGNMMTGAALIGIDSCPIEGFEYEAVNRLLAEAGIFDPAEWGVATMVTFGYRAKDISRKARKPVEEVVQWVE